MKVIQEGGRRKKVLHARSGSFRAVRAHAGVGGRRRLDSGPSSSSAVCSSRLHRLAGPAAHAAGSTGRRPPGGARRPGTPDGPGHSRPRERGRPPCARAGLEVPESELDPKGQTYGGGLGSTPSVAGRVAADRRRSHRWSPSARGLGGRWSLGEQRPRPDVEGAHGRSALARGSVRSHSIGPDPAKVYAGTGEGQGRIPGQGLLRSTDGGTTWRMTAADTFGGTFFNRLIVDPTNRRRVFAATRRGIFATTDAVRTWTRSRAGLTWDLSIGPGAVPETEPSSCSPRAWTVCDAPRTAGPAGAACPCGDRGASRTRSAGWPSPTLPPIPAWRTSSPPRTTRSGSCVGM